MPMTLSKVSRVTHNFRRVGILFAGGPAPAANAVISTAAVSFLRHDIEVLGIRYGYLRLMSYSDDKPLEENEDYIAINHHTLKRSRNTRGIMIGTSRANPGRFISSPAHLDDPERNAPLQTVYDGLRSLKIDALVSIGGDDTLKSANKFKLFQDRLPEEQRIPIVHVPKTIDNDYTGIDFTFGYFTAVELLAEEVRNVLADAETDGSYFICETMGRSAGWLAYGAAIAGEASLVISVEDITGKYRSEETVKTKSGEVSTRPVMNFDEVVNRIVRTVRVREEDENKPYGVIVIAEGLAEYLTTAQLKDIPRDPHGHISVADVNLVKMIANAVRTEYEYQTGRRKRFRGIQLGYETRCSQPSAYDVILGSQLGVGAYRALVEKKLTGVMVSVKGQFDLHYVPFEELIDPKSLVTKVRFVRPGSDFHQLTRFLETYIND